MATSSIHIERPSVPFYQINLQHCKAATALLCERLSKLQTFIVLIQEPWTTQGAVRGFEMLSGCTLFSHTCSRPRTCILASKNLKATMMNQLCDQDTVTVTLDSANVSGKQKVVVCSTYMPYDSMVSPPPEMLKEVITYSNRRGFSFIIGCDANAHHVSWGSSDTNERGENLLEYILSANLSVVNRGCKPTFVTSRRQEVIDITLCSLRMYNCLHDWRVVDEETLSDHKLICFQMYCRQAEETRTRPVRRTDWEGFHTSLNNSLPILDRHIAEKEFYKNPSQHIENVSELLLSSITEAFEANCPLRMIRRSAEVSHPWWNDELAKLRRQTNRSYQKAYRAKGKDNEDALMSQYKEHRTNYKKLINRRKQDSWRLFCETTEGASATAKLVRFMLKTTPKAIGSLVDSSGQYTTSLNESLNVLVEHFFPVLRSKVTGNKCEHNSETYYRTDQQQESNRCHQRVQTI